MSQLPSSDPVDRSDGELLDAVRRGDVSAYGTLFERHRAAALRLARQITGPSDADDLVSDAFAKVLNVLRRGGGPELAFRAYLLTAVRRLHVDKIRASKLVMPTERIEEFDPGLPFHDTAVDRFESAAAGQAFASLPERWQLVLWHLEVEGQKPAEVAPLLGTTANSVSALGYRAREGLRQAYLQMHLNATDDESCRWVTERLGARVRQGLSRRDVRTVDAHLESCRACTGVYLELREVNSSLAGLIGPVLLGSAAAGYLAATGTAPSGGAGGLLLLFKARHLAKVHGLLATSGAAAGVAVVAAAAVVLTQHIPPASHQAAKGLGALTSTTSFSAHQATSGPGPARVTRPHRLARTHTAPPMLLRHRHPVATHPPFTAPVRTTQGAHPTFAPTSTVPTPPPTTQPPTTPPSTSPTTTRGGQSTVDVSVDLAVVPGRGRSHKFSATITAHTQEPATRLRLEIDLPAWRGLRVSAAGWRGCSPQRGVEHYVCWTDAATPGQVSLTLHYQHPPPELMVRISAVDIDDPHMSNNVRSWTATR